MFPIGDLCLLCHTNSNKFKDILSEDTDGVVIEKKLKFFLFELVQSKLAISKQICLNCLKNLNFVYKFKHMCLRNIIKFNNNLHTLGDGQKPPKNVQLTVIDKKTKKPTEIIGVKVNSDTKLTNRLSFTPNLNSNVISRAVKEIQVPANKIIVQKQPRYEVITINNGLKEMNVNVTSQTLNLYSNTDSRTVKEVSTNKVILQKQPRYEIITINNGLESSLEETMNVNDVAEIITEKAENIDKQNSEPKEANFLINKLELKTTEKDVAEIISTEKDDDINEQIISETKATNFLQNILEFKTTRKDYTKFKRIRPYHPRPFYSGAKPFKCEICDRYFGYLNTLTEHQRIHQGEEPHRCDCGATFPKLSDFKSHQQTHVDPKPFECSFCKMAFAEKRFLQRHQKRLHLEKEFLCDICDKGFAFRGRLAQHMREHTGEFPFQCKECPRKFNTRGNYRKHLETHSGDDKQFKCELCPCKYPKKFGLTQHKRLVHSIRKKK